jgi:NifU-like protein involved in Fe-S cluster formation
LYETLSQDLAVSHLLLQRKEAVQRQGVFANKRHIGQGRHGARICGADRRVTINVAVEQLIIAGVQRKERIVILRSR